MCDSCTPGLEELLRTSFLLSTLLLLGTAASAQALVTHCQTQSVDFSVSSQDIVLSPGTDGTAYCVSTNKTWAQMNVTWAGDYFQNVLNIANQNAVTGYQVELEIAYAAGIDFLSNFTVYLDNGTLPKQVEIVNGVITQSIGSWCTLACSSSICISVALQMNAPGVSSACLKLHAVKDGTMSPLFVQTIIVNLS
jgi:hypothetical protein